MSPAVDKLDQILDKGWGVPGASGSFRPFRASFCGFVCPGRRCALPTGL